MVGEKPVLITSGIFLLSFFPLINKINVIYVYLGLKLLPPTSGERLLRKR